MLTTFGPSNVENGKLLVTKINELGHTFSRLKEDTPAMGNEDIEMTFGMIGSHNGNTSMSNTSLRTSQYHHIFGSTFR